jgi:hypothetical protein
VEHEYSPATRLRAVTHGDGDNKRSSGAYRSVAESLVDHKKCAIRSLSCVVAAHGDGDSELRRAQQSTPPPLATMDG